MKPQITRLSAWLSLVIVSGYVICPTFCRADATGISGPAPGSMATKSGLQPLQVLGLVKAAIGKVDRREPEGDDNFGPLKSCKKGDQLLEGSLVETGNKSFADLVWSGTTTRLWQNSIIRILPCAKTVHLVNGGMVFYKSRNCKDAECIVETKRLQARIRGTSVRFLTSNDVDSVLVQEMGGKDAVEIYNKVNGSRLSLAVGVVLEIRGKVMNPDPKFLDSKSQAGESAPTANLKLNPNKGELIFQDKQTQTVAYTANAKAVLADPMLQGTNGGSEFDSMDLIRAAMAKVPSSDNAFENMLDLAFNAGKPDKLISKNFKILGVPTKNSYFIGPNVGGDKSIPLPEMAYADFPPGGVITALQAGPNTKQVAQLKVAAPVALPMLHDQTPPAELSLTDMATAGANQLTPLVTNDSVAPDTVSDKLQATPFKSEAASSVQLNNGIGKMNNLHDVVSKSNVDLDGQAN